MTMIAESIFYACFILLLCAVIAILLMVKGRVEQISVDDSTGAAQLQIVDVQYSRDAGTDYAFFTVKLNDDTEATIASADLLRVPELRNYHAGDMLPVHFVQDTDDCVIQVDTDKLCR